ncbi:hypothetical protein ACMYSQ_003450 [Aspergillus niger]
MAEADPSDINTAKEPKALEFPPITEQEMRDAIKHAPADKTPGINAIFNRV